MTKIYLYNAHKNKKTEIIIQSSQFIHLSQVAGFLLSVDFFIMFGYGENYRAPYTT